MTLTLDQELSRRLTSLRSRYFPRERNFLDAHLTLFHALPGSERLSITQTLERLARDTLPMPARTAGVLDFGGGAAFLMEVDGLDDLHARLRERWKPWLTAQDDRKLKPHVTIQNKVDRETARATQEAMRAMPQFEGQAVGLALWHYRGGPWEEAEKFPFSDCHE